VLLKTRGELVSRVTDTIVETHPYETPEVIVLEIVGGNPAYLEWIGQVTTPSDIRDA
jgi:periplasmic divalent cation tolerance protein